MRCPSLPTKCLCLHLETKKLRDGKHPVASLNALSPMGRHRDQEAKDLREARPGTTDDRLKPQHNQLFINMTTTAQRRQKDHELR